MNYTEIANKLKEFKEIEVNIFINYLKSLETAKDSGGKLKNAWFKYFTDEQAINLYKQVSNDGLFIDGDTVSLTFKGKVMVSYNYQAYKNLVLFRYPETIFDAQLVYEGDEFSFEKQSGKVVYNHKINNPFENKKIIIGCYCIIKNKRGEFIETLNTDEIKKMRNVAKTQMIWEAWTGEMYLKSVIKRTCKRNFKDIVEKIEVIDNENYDLEKVTIDSEISKEIENAKTNDELTNIYNKHKDNVDEVKFIELLSERKKEIANENI